jgi:hypothetical protein
MSPLPRPKNPIAAAVAGTLGGVVLIFVVLAWTLIEFPDEPDLPDDPEARPAADVLAESRARDQATLNSYGWVDREKGVVRLPIDRAIEKLIEESGRK